MIWVRDREVENRDGYKRDVSTRGMFWRHLCSKWFGVDFRALCLGHRFSGRDTEAQPEEGTLPWSPHEPVTEGVDRRRAQLLGLSWRSPWRWERYGWWGLLRQVLGAGRGD